MIANRFYKATTSALISTTSVGAAHFLRKTLIVFAVEWCLEGYDIPYKLIHIGITQIELFLIALYYQDEITYMDCCIGGCC